MVPQCLASKRVLSSADKLLLTDSRLPSFTFLSGLMLAWHNCMVSWDKKDSSISQWIAVPLPWSSGCLNSSGAPKSQELNPSFNAWSCWIVKPSTCWQNGGEDNLDDWMASEGLLVLAGADILSETTRFFWYWFLCLTLGRRFISNDQGPSIWTEVLGVSRQGVNKVGNSVSISIISRTLGRFFESKDQHLFKRDSLKFEMILQHFIKIKN